MLQELKQEEALTNLKDGLLIPYLTGQNFPLD